MIQVEHLTKLYGSKTAIADVSFSLEKGEVLAFLGPNGEIGRASCRERV